MRKLTRRTNRNIAQKKPGFTLVEILVVIVVIGLLFMVFVPRIDFASNSARETGVKSDFRSFSLAAEQVLRENAGIAFVSNTTAGDGGQADIEAKLNKYLDPALQFTSGTCAQKDPWNQPYKLYTNSKKGSNNGTMTFVCTGKNGTANVTTVANATTTDDFIITVTYVNGVINTWTDGFSSDIEATSTTLPTL